MTEDLLVRPLTTWTVNQLKDFVRDHHLPVTGVKLELVNRVGACYDTESELKVVPFQQFPSDTPVPKFGSLPEIPWRQENLPLNRK